MKKLWILMLLFAAPAHAEETITIAEMVEAVNAQTEPPLRVSPSIILESLIGDDTSMTYIYTMQQLKADLNLQLFEVAIRGDKTAYACLLFREDIENLEAITHEYFDAARKFVIAVTFTETDCQLH